MSFKFRVRNIEFQEEHFVFQGFEACLKITPSLLSVAGKQNHPAHNLNIKLFAFLQVSKQLEKNHFLFKPLLREAFQTKNTVKSRTFTDMEERD